jgi:hypothetical protein
MQQPVVDRAPDEVLGELDTNAGPQFTALTGPLERCLGHVAAWPKQPVEVLLGERRVAVHFGDERAEHPRVVASSYQPHPRPQQRDEITAQRSGIEVRNAAFGPFGIQRVESEGFLGRPPAVDRGLADARVLGDGIHAHRIESVFEQQFGCRVQDRLARLFAAGSAAACG